MDPADMWRAAPLLCRPIRRPPGRPRVPPQMATAGWQPINGQRGRRGARGRAGGQPVKPP
eukprot:641859-Prorocentrum_minimum.AAC.1